MVNTNAARNVLVQKLDLLFAHGAFLKFLHVGPLVVGQVGFNVGFVFTFVTIESHGPFGVNTTEMNGYR